MRDNYQGGSLGGYIIVAVLLALVLIGGLYGLQRYNASREGDASPEVARENSDENRDQATNDDKANNDNKEENRQSQDDASNQSENETDTKSEPTQSDEQKDEELPATGPAETAVTALALGALTFAGVSYQRSRR